MFAEVNALGVLVVQFGGGRGRLGLEGLLAGGRRAAGVLVPRVAYVEEGVVGRRAERAVGVVEPESSTEWSTTLRYKTADRGNVIFFFFLASRAQF